MLMYTVRFISPNYDAKLFLQHCLCFHYGALLVYSPIQLGDGRPIAAIMENHNPQVHLRRRALDLVAVGGPVLPAHLVELGLNDLHDLRVVWVGLGDAHMQRSHLQELLV